MSEEEKKIFDEANEEARLYGFNEGWQGGEEKGIEKGIKKGIKKGIEKSRATVINNMKAMGMDDATIERALAGVAA